MLGSSAAAREAFFDFTYEPRRDAGGNVTGVRVIGVETTQIKHAQRLTAEHRVLLEQIARQAPLTEVLEGMARAIEDLAPEEVLVSVLLADAEGRHLRHGAGPSAGLGEGGPGLRWLVEKVVGWVGRLCLVGF